MVTANMDRAQRVFANCTHCLKCLQVLIPVIFEPPHWSPFHRGGRSMQGLGNRVPWPIVGFGFRDRVAQPCS